MAAQGTKAKGGREWGGKARKNERGLRAAAKQERRKDCGHCGEIWPCTDSQRTDIRGDIRAQHMTGN